MKTKIKLQMILCLIAGLLVMSTISNASTPCIDNLYTSGCIYGDGLTSWKFANVEVNAIPCEGVPSLYKDYTNQIHELTAGFTYELEVTVGYGTTFLAVWIDYDGDYDMTHSEKLFDNQCFYANTQYTFEVTIPNTVSQGNVLLRVRTNWLSAVTDPCVSYTYGNCLDFRANVSGNSVINPPSVFAGEDATLCMGYDVELLDAVATDFAQLFWVSNGSGTFSNPHSQNPIYFPGTIDFILGSVELCLLAAPLPPYQTGAYDCLILSFQNQPEVVVGVEGTAYCGSYEIIAAEAVNFSYLYWSTSGDGYFDNPNVKNPTYFQGDEDCLNGNVVLCLTAYPVDPCAEAATACLNLTIISGNMDFGDAPDSYQTLLASNGARHIVDGVTFLGYHIDAEPDGLPSPGADGDDLDNVFDEDGVTFETPFTAGASAKLKIRASVAGYLNAWLDLDGSGSWSEAGEHVFADVPLAGGLNTITLDIPHDAAVGFTYMRFRFNTQGGLNYYGLADNGEVEDYRVNIYPVGWSFEITPNTHIIFVPVALELHGLSITPNDAFGVFYTDDNGDMACGGAAVYDGVNNQVVIAYGNDITTTKKDGFEDGDMLKWKIHSSNSGQEQWVDVVYDQNLPNHDGIFVTGGLSALTSVCKFYELNIKQGWSGISTWFNPLDKNIENMFSPVFAKLKILYNFAGTYWPDQYINTLVDWDIYSGHVIKVTEDVTLSLCGQDITNRTIELTPGWNLIPVFSEVAVTSVFGGLPGFMIAKGIGTTEIYWPSFGLNNMHSLKIGRAYYVYTSQPGTITYGKGGSENTSGNIEAVTSTPWNDLIMTPYSHLVAFTPESFHELSTGDMLVAFTQSGLCAGASVIDDNKISVGLTIYGNDPTTPETDGFIDGEPLIIKAYCQKSNELVDLDLTWENCLNDSGLFQTNSLSAVIDLKMAASVIADLTTNNLNIFPNPASSSVFIEAFNASSTQSKIEIFDMSGRLVTDYTINFVAGGLELDIRKLTQGFYFVTLSDVNSGIVQKGKLVKMGN